MSRIEKFIITLLLATVTAFGVAGCNAGTNELQDKIDSLQNQLEEMNGKLVEIEKLNDEVAEMEEKIEQLEKDLQDLKYEIQNYVLKISADKQVYNIDDEIFINIMLENRSGEDKEIAYYFLFYPESPTGQFPADEQPPVTTKKIFENGESINMMARLGGCFPAGQHELKYKAVFYLSWEMTEFGYETTDCAVEVWSNTLEISVIE